jgi:hypothetical protein
MAIRVRACASRRRSVAGAAAAVSLLTAIFVVSAGAASALPSGSAPGGVADAQSAVDATDAVMIAQRYGHEVEISSLDAEYSTVFAEPDGTWRQALSATPVRVERAGAWVPVDLTLAQDADGAIGPKASAAVVSLGSAGSTTVATLAVGSGSMSYGWPAPLPAPTLDGASATYPDVLPGVSLVVTVSALGVETSVVFADRQAAVSAGAVRLPLSVSGLTARLDSAAGLDYVDASGLVVAQTPRPQAWDMRMGGTVLGPGDGPSGAGPSQITTGAGAVLSPAGTTTAGTVVQATGALSDSLQVPAALLDDPSTTYPLVLDPGFHLTGGEGLDGYIESDGDTEIDSSFDSGRVHVGTFDGGSTITRGLYQFSQGPSHGATIFSASLTLNNDYSYSCTASGMTVYKAAAFSSSVSWPGPTITSTNAVSQSFAHGYSSSCAAADVTFDVTGIVADAANDSGATNYTFELRASSETSSTGWKKFGAIAGFSVYFDRAPYTATSQGFKTAKPTTPTGCVTGSGRPTVDATQAMSWQATMTDPDASYGDQVRGIWKYWDLATASTLNWVHSGYFASGSKPSVSFAGSTTTFLDGHNYGWAEVTQDLAGIDSGYTSTCEFHVSDPAPNTPTGLRFADPSLSCGATAVMRGDQQITLTATISDPDGKYGKAVRADFALAGTSWTGDSPFEVNSASFSATSPPIPAGTLADGTSFSWTVKADNGQKTSATASCTGRIDDAAPATPQIGGGTAFSSGSAHVGDVDTLTFNSDATTTAYVWELAAGAASSLPGPGTCGTASSGVHTVCSSQGAGWNSVPVEAPYASFTVSVAAYNSAGQASPISTEAFSVSEWQPSHAWVTGDIDPTAGQSTVGDRAGSLPLTLAGSGVSWYNDNNPAAPWTNGATSLRFDGTGEADTGSGNPAVTDDATHSFSLALWVRPSTASSSAANVAAAQDGTVVSGFWIGQQAGSWQFCMADTQSLSTSEDCATAPQGSDYVGTWTMLVAVWDANAQQMRLFVNGTDYDADNPVGHTATAAAAGAFTLGQSLNGSEVPSWAGDVIDPITYPGVVSADQVSILADCGPGFDQAAYCP